MSIGLFVPYRQSEQALAAVRLADTLMELDHQVVLYSPCKPKTLGLAWDRRVIDGHKIPFDVCSGAIDWWIWFEHVPSLLKVSPPENRNTLVVSWHRLKPSQEDSVRCYSEIIAPAECVADELRARELVTKLMVTHWDSVGALQAAQRISLVHSPCIFSRLPERFESSDVFKLTIFEALLRIGYTVNVERPANSLPNNAVRFLSSLAASYPARLNIFPHMQLLKRYEQLSRHSAIVILESHDDLGYYCLEALGRGAVAMCYDMSPRQELLKDRQNSILLPCNLELGYLHAPRVVPAEQLDLQVFHEKLRKSATGRSDIYGYVEERRTKFVAFWAALLSSKGHALMDKL